MLYLIPGLTQFLVLSPGCLYEVLHTNDSTILSRIERCCKSNVLNIPSSQPYLLRQNTQIDISIQRSFVRKYYFPDVTPVFFIRERKLYNYLQPTQKCFINILI